MNSDGITFLLITEKLWLTATFVCTITALVQIISKCVWGCELTSVMQSIGRPDQCGHPSFSDLIFYHTLPNNGKWRKHKFLELHLMIDLTTHVHDVILAINGSTSMEDINSFQTSLGYISSHFPCHKCISQ